MAGRSGVRNVCEKVKHFLNVPDRATPLTFHRTGCGCLRGQQAHTASTDPLARAWQQHLGRCCGERGRIETRFVIGESQKASAPAKKRQRSLPQPFPTFKQRSGTARGFACLLAVGAWGREGVSVWKWQCVKVRVIAEPFATFFHERPIKTETAKK